MGVLQPGDIWGYPGTTCSFHGRRGGLAGGAGRRLPGVISRALAVGAAGHPLGASAGRQRERPGSVSPGITGIKRLYLLCVSWRNIGLAMA